jgi:hypothetical protein
MPIHEFVDQYVTDYSGSPNTNKQMEDLSSAVFSLTNGNEDHMDILEKAIDKYLETKTDLGAIDKESKFQVKIEEREKEEKRIDDLFKVQFPPVFKEALFLTEAGTKLRASKVKRWITDHSEQWNELMAYIEEQKPYRTGVTVPAQKGQPKKTIPSPEYTEWKNTYRKYLDADRIFKFQQE